MTDNVKCDNDSLRSLDIELREVDIDVNIEEAIILELYGEILDCNLVVCLLCISCRDRECGNYG